MGNDLMKIGNFTTISQKTAIIIQQLHLELLEKHHLKVTDWQMARSKIENNFVDYLKEGFV